MTLTGSVKALGWRTALSYAAARTAAATGAFGYHRYLIVAVPRAGMPKLPRGYEVRSLNAADLRDFVIDAPPEVQAARFREGLDCIGAFETGALAGVNWLGVREHREDEVAARYLLPDDAAWDTGLWIRPERRLSRTFAALWAGTAEWLAARGLARSMSRIADYNSASIASHRRMHAEVIGTLTAVEVAGWQLAVGGTPALTRVRSGAATVDLRRC